MTKNSMFSITKIIFCIVLYSVSEPFINDYIEPDWTRTTLYVYQVVSICMDTFLQLDSLYFHFSVLIQLIHFQLVDRQKHYYCILERNIIRPTQQVEKLVAMPSVVIKESQIFIKVSMVCVWSVGRAHGDTGQALMRTQSGLLLCCGRQ
jgi:hypothetical protein